MANSDLATYLGEYIAGDNHPYVCVAYHVSDSEREQITSLV